MNRELEKLGAKCDIKHSCSCSNKQTTYTYLLPIKIDEHISDFLLPIGNPATSLAKQRLLRIENRSCSIIAISRMKQIKLTIKAGSNIVEQFENLLVDYLKSKY